MKKQKAITATTILTAIGLINAPFAFTQTLQNYSNILGIPEKTLFTFMLMIVLVIVLAQSEGIDI